MGVRRGLLAWFGDVDRVRQTLGARNHAYLRIIEYVRALCDGSLEGDGFKERLEHAWRERTFPAYHERPLLLLAAMRCEALAEGPRHPLYRWIVQGSVDADSMTPAHVREAVRVERLGFWVSLATRRVQTNDVSRSVGWRWPVQCLGLSGRPLVLVDIGTAAGLNLLADQLPSGWIDEHGSPLDVAERVRTIRRIGYDTHPLDVRNEEDVRWLRACIWPGEIDRLSRFESAVNLFRAALESGRDWPELSTLSARLVPQRLSGLMETLPGNGVLLAVQSFLRSYLEPEQRTDYEEKMATWLRTSGPGRALWCVCEPSDDPGGAWPAEVHVSFLARTGSVESFVLGRCDYHPTRVSVDPVMVDTCAREFAGGRPLLRAVQ